MPRIILDNHAQSPFIEQLLSSDLGIAVSTQITWDLSTSPEHLDRVQCGLIRNPDTDFSDAPTGAESVRITLGSTAFASDVADGLAYPDWLPAGDAMTYVLVVDVGLTDAVRNAGLWVTVWGPSTRNVGTLHVNSTDTIFTSTQLRTLRGDVDHGHPLWLYIEGYSSPSSLLADVVALQGVDHGVFTAVIAGAHLRKKTRITVWEVDFSLNGPPYQSIADLPVVSNPVILSQVTNYSISVSDRFQSDQLTLELALSDFESAQGILVENCMITVDERYDDAVDSTGWVRKGTFFMDDAEDRIDVRSHTVSVRARDALKLTTLHDIQRKVWPDIMHVARKRLVNINNPKKDLDCFYIFTDGPEDAHTYEWSEKPHPRLWVQDKGTRIEISTGQVDVDFRDGEVLIERAYYEGGIFYGGLGDPKWIEAEYWRIARPEDESFTYVTSVSADTISLSMPSSDRWLGCTIAVLRGAGAHRSYRIVAASGSDVKVDGTPEDDGVGEGAAVQIITSARVEQVIYDMMIESGFQDLDPSSPFYIERVAKPGNVVVTVPADQDFDFSSNNLKTAFSVIEEVGKWLPPDVLYRTDSLGRVVTLFLNQKVTGDYEIPEPSQVSVSRNDSDLFTRVVYKVRDRSYVNILSESSPYVSGSTCPDSYVNKLIHYQNEKYMGHLVDPGERVGRVLTDGKIRTAVMWLYDFPPKEFVKGGLDHLDGHVLIQWDMASLIHANQVLIRGINREWAAGQEVRVEISEDGALWDTVGEVIFGGSAEVQTIDVTNQPFRHFRLVALSASYIGVDLAVYGAIIIPPLGAAPPVTLYQHQPPPTPPLTTVLPGGIVSVVTTQPDPNTTTTLAPIIPSNAPVQAGIGLSSVEVYLDDVVEGIVELGVDRFEGETDVQFADDIAVRNRLGLRTLVVDGIDERGYEISRALGVSVSSYGKARAAEYLAEVISAFDQVKLTEVRPDHAIGDTVAINAERLALGSVSYLTRGLEYSGDGTGQATAVNYRPARSLIVALEPSALTRSCNPDFFPPSTTTIPTTTTPHREREVIIHTRPTVTITQDTRTTGTTAPATTASKTETTPPTATTTTSCVTTDYPGPPRNPPASFECGPTTLSVALFSVNHIDADTGACVDNPPGNSLGALLSSAICYVNGVPTGTPTYHPDHISFAIDNLCPDDIVDFQGIYDEHVASIPWSRLGNGVWTCDGVATVDVHLHAEYWAHGALGRVPGALVVSGCFDMDPVPYGNGWPPPDPDGPFGFLCPGPHDDWSPYFRPQDFSAINSNPSESAVVHPGDISYTMDSPVPVPVTIIAHDPRDALGITDDSLSEVADVTVWRQAFDLSPVSVEHTTMGTDLTLAAHPNPWVLPSEGPGYIAAFGRDEKFSCWQTGIDFLRLPSPVQGWITLLGHLGNDAPYGEGSHSGQSPVVFNLYSDCDTSRSLPIHLRVWLMIGNHRVPTSFRVVISNEGNYSPQSGFAGRDASSPDPVDMPIYDQCGFLHRAQDVGPPPARAYVIRVSDGHLMYWDGQNLTDIGSVVEHP